MHICYLCNEYTPHAFGGIGSVTQALARSMAARGHKVTVVGVYLTKHDSEEADGPVRVIKLKNTPIPGTGYWVNGWRVRRVLNEIHRTDPIDIIEGAEGSLATLPARTAAARVIRMHGGHHFFAATLGKKPRPWKSWLEKRGFRRADALCAVSQYVGTVTRNLLRLGDAPIEVLYNPVNVENFRPAEADVEEEGLIVFTGSICEKKGIRQLVLAMPKVLEAVPHARLEVAGRDTRDPDTGQSFTEQLKALIPPHVKPHVTFLGAVEHSKLPQLLARAAVCVYPSHMEALGVACIEALASGKAVVATNAGPGPEVIEDEVSGLLCDPHDSASIADALVRVLKDDELRGRLGQAARQRAVDLFSIEAVIGDNEKFYQRIITSNGK